MTDITIKVPEVVRPTAAEFQNDIYPKAMPVVLRGVAEDWALVLTARRSDRDLVEYLKKYDAGVPIEVLTGAPEIEGRFFYTDDLRGVNFSKSPSFLADVLEELASSDAAHQGQSTYVQATPLSEILPKLNEENQLALAPPNVEPRIWIGNSVTIQTHFDLSQNIACVASGRRRFTLFPPDQTPNLYMGPIEHTPSGTPVSLVSLDDVDYDRFPKFREAERHALIADLNPGDAIFIPYLWWHHVRSFGKLNILLNYWWNEYGVLGSPMDAMLLGILTMRDMPPAMRAAWKTMFDHFVFGENGPSADHIPVELRGGLGALSWPMRRHLWSALSSNIGQFTQMLKDQNLK